MYYDIGYNNGPLAILCHIVYATLGFKLFAAGVANQHVSCSMNEKFSRIGEPIENERENK